MSDPLIVYWNSVIDDMSRAIRSKEANKAHSHRDEVVYEKRMRRLHGKKFLRLTLNRLVSRH